MILKRGFNMSDINNKDIFDSIKKMVESEENASVLELTDMVTSDGKIVKVSKGETVDQYDQQGETDVGTFLKLMQNNDREKSEDISNKDVKGESSEIIKKDRDIDLQAKTGIANNVSGNNVLGQENIEEAVLSRKKIENRRDNSVIKRSVQMENNNEKTVSNLTKHFDDATGSTMNNEYIRRIVQNYVKGYLEITLPALVKKTVEDEVKNMLKNMM